MPVVSSTPSGITVGDLVDSTRLHLVGVTRSIRDRLTDAINADDAELSVAFDAERIKPGDYLGIGDEVLYVWDRAGATVTVERGELGTQPAGHDTGAPVEIGPRFPRGLLLRRLVDEIRSWPRDLYAVIEEEVVVGSSDDAVDLPGAEGTDVYRVLSAERSPVGSEERWTPVDAVIRRRQNTTDFPSGYAVLFDVGFSATVRLVYARSFTLSPFTSATDIADVGLDEHLADLAPIGAAWRLMAGAESARSDSRAQGQSRRAEEVPPGAARAQAEYLRALRRTRIDEERARRLGDYGWGHGL